MSAARCARCGAAVDPDDGFWVLDCGAGRHATLCRLEHVVPWVMRGPRWRPGGVDTGPGPAPDRCSQCDGPVGEGQGLVLVRRRGPGVAVADGFCSTDHLRAWALAGGRWR